MYIVAIAWLYVLMLVSVMQPTVFRGIVTFLGAGLLPLGLFLYLVGTPQRRRHQRRAALPEETPAAPELPLTASVDQAPGIEPGPTLKTEDRSR